MSLDVQVRVRLACYLLACVALILVRSRPFPVVAAALLAVGGTASALGRTTVAAVASGELPAGSTRQARAVWRFGGAVTLGPFVVGVALVAVWACTRVADIGFLGLALAYIGAGGALVALRRRAADPVGWGGVVLLGAVGVGSIGLLASRWWAPAFAVVLLALAITPIGVALVSSGWERARTPSDRPAGGRAESVGPHPRMVAVVARLPGGVFALVGIALLGVAGALIARSEAPAGTATAVVAVSLVLALAIAARSNVDVVLVVLVVAAVWSTTNRHVEDPWDPQPGEPVLVALGDSYISGEGASAFYLGTNAIGVDECRRAPTAYPVLLTLARSESIDDLLFVACSGAVVGNLDGQLAQVAASGVRAQVVLLSIGGNDVGFGSIARTCLGPGDCSVLLPDWLAQLDALERGLTSAYQFVGRETGAPVVVVPYPQPFGDPDAEGCTGSLFTSAERRALTTFVRHLDDTIERAAVAADQASDVSVSIVADAELAFIGHRLCEAPPGETAINLVALNGKVGPLEQALNPSTWVHNSVHPNELGHRLLAAAVARHLAGEEPEFGAPAPPEDVGTSTGPCAESANPSDLVGCQNAWSIARIAGFLVAPGLVAAVAFLGAWMVALVVLERWHLLLDPPPGDGEL